MNDQTIVSKTKEILFNSTKCKYPDDFLKIPFTLLVISKRLNNDGSFDSDRIIFGEYSKIFNDEYELNNYLEKIDIYFNEAFSSHSYAVDILFCKSMINENNMFIMSCKLITSETVVVEKTFFDNKN